jgi:hypothetical protein
MPDRRTFATGILPSALSELTALRHPLPSLVSYAGSRGTGDPSPPVWRRYRPAAIDSRAAWATASAVIPKCL